MICDMTEFLANLKLERAQTLRRQCSAFSLHCRLSHFFFCVAGIGSFHMAYLKLREAKGRTFYAIEPCHARESG